MSDVWLKLSVCTRVLSLCWCVFWHFTCFLTERNLSCVLRCCCYSCCCFYYSPHLDLSCSDLHLKFMCFENFKKRSCFGWMYLYFFGYFLIFFLQLSIRLQLHTETKGSILNHSISYYYFFLDRSLRVLRLPRINYFSACCDLFCLSSVINENVNKRTKGNWSF